MSENDDPIPELAPGVYRHYKGRLYHVLGAARHSEDGSHVAVYRPLPPTPYQSGLRVRPLEMFCDRVDLEGDSVPRFELVEPQGSAETGA